MRSEVESVRHVREHAVLGTCSLVDMIEVESIAATSRSTRGTDVAESWTVRSDAGITC